MKSKGDQLRLTNKSQKTDMDMPKAMNTQQ